MSSRSAAGEPLRRNAPSPPSMPARFIASRHASSSLVSSATRALSARVDAALESRDAAYVQQALDALLARLPEDAIARVE